MSVNITDDGFTVSSGYKILDFTIDTTGVNLFVTNCRPVESKQSTYSIGNCTTVNCTTIQCTTVDCTTVDCTTIRCNTVQCSANCNCRHSDCNSDS